jgi:hypothetical protein
MSFQYTKIFTKIMLLLQGMRFLINRDRKEMEIPTKPTLSQINKISSRKQIGGKMYIQQISKNAKKELDRKNISNWKVSYMNWEIPDEYLPSIPVK